MTPEQNAQLMDCFPAVRHAFAYGSAAFTQPGLYRRAGAHPMLDYIFVVECPSSWHRLNLQRNAGHYSCIARLHPSVVTCLGDVVGVGVYFNPAVQALSRVIKYGVVGIDTLLRDLTAWDTLLVAGRLHKPVNHIVQDTAVMAAVSANLQAALAASLLMLPRGFTTQELFESLCGISYLGDIRMSLAEDRYKVQRIVAGSWDPLQQLYKPAIEGSIGRLANLTAQGQGHWSQDTGLPSRAVLLARLPQSVKAHLAGRASLLPGSASCAEPGSDVNRAVKQALQQIVRRSSLRQACLGLFSAGGLQGVSYVWAKVQKRWANQ